MGYLDYILLTNKLTFGPFCVIIRKKQYFCKQFYQLFIVVEIQPVFSEAGTDNLNAV